MIVLKGLCSTEFVNVSLWKPYLDRNPYVFTSVTFVKPFVNNIRSFIVVDPALWTRQMPTGRWLSTKNVKLKNWSGGSILQAESTVLCRSICSCSTGEIFYFQWDVCHVTSRLYCADVCRSSPVSIANPLQMSIDQNNESYIKLTRWGRDI